MEQRGLDFGATEPARPAPRRALTVSELTERVQGVLETDFFDVWVEGEVSNLRFAPSGHWYFSLKDDQAQVRAVVWKTATRPAASTSSRWRCSSRSARARSSRPSRS